MFDYLTGQVARLAPQLAVIDCGGIGYACRTTAHTLARLKTGEGAKLYTHLYLREDLLELYGFISEGERTCFQLLIGVSGVGPKAALSILSASDPEGVAMAVITGSEKALTVAPGIGKKIAQRIILELKDKLAKGQLPAEESYGGAAVTLIPENKGSEAAAALAVLGYSPAEISAALKGIDIPALSLEEIVRQALRKMVK